MNHDNGARVGEIHRQLKELEMLSIDELAQRWHALTGLSACRRNKRALVKRLAYAVQEAAFGGLAHETTVRLEEIYYRSSQDKHIVPMTGTMLTREWRGRSYRVTVLPQGFEYGGRLYRSLSSIAREITGTRINGPAFFRLKGAVR